MNAFLYHLSSLSLSLSLSPSHPPPPPLPYSALSPLHKVSNLSFLLLHFKFLRMSILTQTVYCLRFCRSESGCGGTHCLLGLAGLESGCILGPQVLPGPPATFQLVSKTHLLRRLGGEGLSCSRRAAPSRPPCSPLWAPGRCFLPAAPSGKPLLSGLVSRPGQNCPGAQSDRSRKPAPLPGGCGAGLAGRQGGNRRPAQLSAAGHAQAVSAARGVHHVSPLSSRDGPALR